MNGRNSRVRGLGVGGALFICCSTAAVAAGPRTLAGVACERPPPQHCADACVPALLGELGNATEPKSGRRFFLDYPCDLKKNEKVVLILSLHGAGSIGNWQRHYFPAFDYKEKYRLVVATPTAAKSAAIFPNQPPVRMWTADGDDEYLRNLSDYLLAEIGRKNVKAFWLAGHSQGGLTANRIVCTDYFGAKVDGWLSLSGGRIGPAQIAPDFFGPNGPPPALSGGGANSPRPGVASLPSCDLSYVFTSGELEITGLPATSPWAEMYGCAARHRRADIVDSVKGYVTGASPGRPPSWGRDARPGTAQEFVYPGCKGKKLVADVLRLDKGHTEGLEPKVTEELVRLMVSAPGGKLQKSP
jgi:poly(3-hydroxybutyrate) depolymerase